MTARSPKPGQHAGIKELTLPQQLPVNFRQGGLIADTVPFLADNGNLPLHDAFRLLSGKEELRGRRQADIDPAHAVIAVDQHRL